MGENVPNSGPTDEQVKEMLKNASKKKVKRSLKDEVKLPIVIKIAENIEKEGVTWKQDQNNVDTKAEDSDNTPLL